MFYTLKYVVLYSFILHILSLSGNCATYAAAGAGSAVDVLPNQVNGSLCNFQVSSSSSEASLHEDDKGTPTFRVSSTPSSRPPLHSIRTSPERRRVHVCLTRPPRDSFSVAHFLSTAASAPAGASSTTLSTSSSLRALSSRFEEETRMVNECIEMLETKRKYLLDYMPRYLSDAFDAAGKARACATHTQEAFNATLNYHISSYFKEVLAAGEKELVQRVGMQILEKLIQKYLKDA